MLVWTSIPYSSGPISSLYIHVPPIFAVCSNIVTWWPAFIAYFAAHKPDNPPPITAMFFFIIHKNGSRCTLEMNDFFLVFFFSLACENKRLSPSQNSKHSQLQWNVKIFTKINTKCKNHWQRQISPFTSTKIFEMMKQIAELSIETSK